MKYKSLKILIPFLLVGLASFTILDAKRDPFKVEVPFINNNAGKEQVTLDVMMKGIESAHYNPQLLNDTFSDHLFRLYVNRLDFNKKFFLKKDITELEKFHYDLDEQVNNRSFAFFERSLELLETRIKESKTYYKEALEKPFDFTKEESIETDGEKLKWANSEAELKEEWRKAMKYQAMLRMSDAIEVQERAKEKKDTVVEIKSMEELEKDARKKVLKSQDDWFDRMTKLTKSERFGMYLSSIANTYDPHTEFFAPKDKENFDIQMSGQLEGIGAQLQEKDGEIKVSSIVPGSASARQGQLKAGDVILKVAQGNDEPVDIVGMRLDDAVKLIRGKKGTEVRLTVRKVDGAILVIPIVRDVVIIEETYAKSAVVNSSKKYGYIRLPGFYADFNKIGGRHSAPDVKAEINKLKKEGVKGIVLDLRNNGGGSLQDAVDMAGLFIEDGPVVQVKGKTGSPTILSDKDGNVVYDGPLVVMVNIGSASASEILAAAIQDYKRGVVVGSNSTFGKGTVQRMFDLDDYLPSSYDEIKPVGSLKLTMQKFYRVNGGTTQLKGVTPDIILPDIYAHIDLGEKEQDYPIGIDEISPASYTPWKKQPDISGLKKKSSERVEKSEGFQIVEEEAQKLKTQKDVTQYSLNLDKFRQEQKKRKSDNKRLEQFEKEIAGLDVVSLSSEKASSDTSVVARHRDWLKALKKDIYLNEAVYILSDMK